MVTQLNAVRIGVISEQLVALELMKLGYRVLMPLDPSSPYDLLVETVYGFTRVQVKTGRIQTKNTLAFNSHARSGSYTGKIDLFAVHNPNTAEVYLIPEEKCPNRTMTIVLNGARALRSDGSGLLHDHYVLQNIYTTLLGPAEAGQPCEKSDDSWKD